MNLHCYSPPLKMLTVTREDGCTVYQSSSWGIFRAWSQRSADKEDRKTRHWIRLGRIHSGKHLAMTTAELGLQHRQRCHFWHTTLWLCNHCTVYYDVKLWAKITNLQCCIQITPVLLLHNLSLTLSVSWAKNSMISSSCCSTMVSHCGRGDKTSCLAISLR